MKRTPGLLLLALLTVFAGCADGVDSFAGVTPRTVAVFAPSSGVVPVPTNLLFSGSEDLTLNLPVADPMDLSDPQVALGRLDGWSPGAPFTFEFSAAIDGATLVEGVTVRFFEVTLDAAVSPIGGPVNSIVRELADAEYDLIIAAEDSTGATFRILLNQPLAPEASYMIVLTDGILDTTGRATGRDAEYDLARGTTLFPPTHPFASLQGLILSQEGFAEAFGVARDSIVISNVFTTQSIGCVLGTLSTVAAGGEQLVIDGICATGLLDCADTTPAITAASAVVDGFIGDTSAFIVGSPGLADIYVGGLTLPYFLTAASNTTFDMGSFDTAPLDEFWRARYPFLTASGPDTERNLTRANPLPEMTGTEEVPLLIAIPNSVAQPPGGWPVVIFSHGITADRLSLLAVADTLCAAGFAVVGIDQPLHGVVDTTSPFFEGFLEGGRRERTFGLDLLNNATNAPVPDGMIDSSGIHFINLANLLTTRDNLRQAVSDLVHLRSVVGAIDVDGGGADFDDAAVSFVGHSFGGIVGTPYLALVGADAATLGMAGIGLPKLLIGSATFGPILTAGLAAAGVTAGTPDFEAFLFAAQTVTDDGDPLHYSAAVTAQGIPVHLIEVVGDGAGNLPDQTVPNSVPDAPLSGTEPMAALMGLTGIDASAMGSPLQVIVRFTEGGHSSLLDPTASAPAFLEMQSQMMSFLASGGTSITITDISVVEPQP